MKAEDQDDDEHAICPYCKNKHYIEGESYDQAGTVMECDECGKKFHYVTQISVSHATNGDCELNGIPHQWEDFNGITEVCELCDIHRMKGVK